MSIVKDLSKKAKIDKTILKNVYNRIIRYNHDALFTAYPDQRIKFTFTDMSDIIKACGVPVSDIEAAVKGSDYISSDFAVSGAPLNIALGLMIFMTHKSDKKFQEIVMVLMAMRFYSTLHIKYYETLPDPAIMRAAIEEMIETNDIRKYKTVFGFIEHKALSNHANMCGIEYKTNKKKGVDRVARGDDKDLHEYVVGQWTRLNNSMRFSISGNFYQAHKDGKFLNEITDEDLPDWLEDVNMSQSINKYATRAALGLQKKVDSNMVRRCAAASSVSYQLMITIANNVCRKNYTEVHLCCLNILGLFLSDKKHKTSQIKSRYFEESCEEIYKQNNANDPRIKDIKAILEALLTEHYDSYTHLKRDATKSNFKKALFLLFVKAIITYA